MVVVSMGRMSCRWSVVVMLRRSSVEAPAFELAGDYDAGWADKIKRTHASSQSDHCNKLKKATRGENAVAIVCSSCIQFLSAADALLPSGRVQ
jgi:hypothetical protein